MNIYLDKIMVYHEIHRLHREGFSIRRISDLLGFDRRTVSRNLAMEEKEFDRYLEGLGSRAKLLDGYESFVVERLRKFSDTSAAQMHDWLKESFPEFPQVSPKTVFNFVSFIRDKHRIPVIKGSREFALVEELPYGKQAQVDFGSYTMRTSTGGKTKVFFFAFLLSKSRARFVHFLDRPFTTATAIEAHEKAFAYFKGIPKEVVYDQDRVFLVSENGGDLILTHEFRTYVREQAFELYFCKKADPQSKGKVENLVKYIKRNFLYNRTYHNLDILRDDSMGWLSRTANRLPHSFTGKEPFEELEHERHFLSCYVPCTLIGSLAVFYAVRKDNCISYKGNFYSLPLGTYTGKGTTVNVLVQGVNLVIEDKDGRELCRHIIQQGKGLKIINTDHKRDKKGTIAEKIKEVSNLFADPKKAVEWLEKVAEFRPRYVRDQLAIIARAVVGQPQEKIERVLDFCLQKCVYVARDFESILLIKEKDAVPDHKTGSNNPGNTKLPIEATQSPETSKIDDYEQLLNSDI